MAAEPSLAQVDPELHALVEHEKARQWGGIELIASENFTSRAVLECLGSCLTNKYSEGLPNARYYGGNEYIDQIEIIAQNRALKAFGLTAEEWAVNVQPYSGSPANLAVYTALLAPHERLMGLGLQCGGHLTHGFYTPKKKVSASSIFFESLPYGLGPDGRIDYDALAVSAAAFMPKLIIVGGSAYSRDYDYARMRTIADSVGAYLMCDMAHFSGLVAAGLLTSPFFHCDVVTTTTHKTLRGPRGAMIYCKKALAEKINQAVFPALQGGPHNNQIAAVATQLREVMTPEFHEYAAQIITNAKAMAEELTRLGYTLVTGGTDNHLVLVDLKPQKVLGSKVQVLCDFARITLNKNTVPGDASAMNPGGVRIGSPAMTSRGAQAPHFVQIARFFDEAVKLALQIQVESGPKLVDFTARAKENAQVAELRGRVFEFSRQFPIPGFDSTGLTAD